MNLSNWEANAPPESLATGIRCRNLGFDDPRPTGPENVTLPTWTSRGINIDPYASAEVHGGSQVKRRGMTASLGGLSKRM